MLLLSFLTRDSNSCTLLSDSLLDINPAPLPLYYRFLKAVCNADYFDDKDETFEEIFVSGQGNVIIARNKHADAVRRLTAALQKANSLY